MIKLLRKYFTFNQENNYKPIQASRLAMGILALILIFNIGLNAMNCYLLRQNSLTANLNTINILAEINKIRVANGLQPLAENPKLNVAALLKAQDMIDNDYFNHYSPSGKTPWDWFSAAQYNYKYAGENLALNFWSDQDTVQAWLDSPTHKENILNPNYKETGLAILSGTTSTTKENRTVVVQMFGAEKTITVIQPKTAIKVTPTTRAIKVTKPTSTTSSISTTVSTTEPIAETTKIVNAVVNDNTANNISDKTLLTNISSTILEQSNPKNQSLALGVDMARNMVSPKITKTINNSFGVGLLFLGIFGILNINSQDKIPNIFRKNLLGQNTLVLLIGLGFLLSNFGYLIIKIKIPTI